MTSTNLFIASEVRSGSTYIAESIAYSFSETYNASFWDASKELFSNLNDFSTGENIVEILSGISENSFGIRSAKLMCASLSIIAREAHKNQFLYDEFFGDNTRWIIVRRRDRVKQAVSLATAIASNTWHFYDSPESAPDNNISIGNAEIYEALKMTILSDDYLDNFSKKVKRCSTVYYEDFIGSEHIFLRKICDELELPLNIDAIQFVSPKLQQTAKVAKKEAEKAFRNYFLENYHKVSS